MINSKKKLKQTQLRKLNIYKKIVALFLIFLFTLNLCNAEFIKDEFAEKTLSKDLKIREYTPNYILDTFALTNKNYSGIKPTNIIYTEILPENITRKIIKYNSSITENKNTPISVRIKNPINTKSKPIEGSPVEFILLNDTKISNKFYPKGTIITARVETFSPRSVWGTPADLIIGNFQIDGTNLQGEINKTGTNRTIWVRPLAILVGVFCGTGFFFIFVKGGQAKINTNENFTLYTN